MFSSCCLADRLRMIDFYRWQLKITTLMQRQCQQKNKAIKYQTKTKQKQCCIQWPVVKVHRLDAMIHQTYDSRTILPVAVAVISTICLFSIYSNGAWMRDRLSVTVLVLLLFLLAFGALRTRVGLIRRSCNNSNRVRLTWIAVKSCFAKCLMLHRQSSATSACSVGWLISCTVIHFK